MFTKKVCSAPHTGTHCRYSVIFPIFLLRFLPGLGVGNPLWGGSLLWNSIVLVRETGSLFMIEQDTKKYTIPARSLP